MPLDPIFNQSIQSYFFKIYFNTTLQSTDESSKMFHAFRFSTDTSYAFLISDMCYMPHSYHPPLFDYSSNHWQTVQIVKLLIMKFPTASSYFSLLGPNILPTPFSQTPSIYVLLTQGAKFSAYTKQVVKTINLCYLNHALEETERQKLLN